MLFILLLLATCDLSVALTNQGILLSGENASATLELYVEAQQGLNLTKKITWTRERLLPFTEIRKADIFLKPECNDTNRKNNFLLYAKKSESNIKGEQDSGLLYQSNTAKGSGVLFAAFCLILLLVIYHEKTKLHCKDHRGSDRVS